MTRIPSFAEIGFAAGDASAGHDAPPRAEAWQTPEGIAIKPAYDARDLGGLDFLDGMPGLVHICVGCMNSFMKYAKLAELQKTGRE